MAAIANPPSTSRNRRKTTPVAPQPSAPWSVEIPKGLGTLASFEFGLRAVLAHWFGDADGKSSIRFEELETIDGEAERLSSYVSLEDCPTILAGVTCRGFGLDGGLEVHIPTQPARRPLVLSEVAKANSIDDRIREVDIRVTRQGDRVVAVPVWDVLSDARVKNEIGDSQKVQEVFAWARAYKPEPTNVIHLPQSLGGGEAYRARELQEPSKESAPSRRCLSDNPDLLTLIPEGGGYSAGEWCEFRDVKSKRLFELAEQSPEHALLSTTLTRWFGDDCAPISIYGNIEEARDDRRECDSPEFESLWFYVQELDRPERWTVELRGFGFEGCAYIFLSSDALLKNPLDELRNHIAKAYNVAEKLVSVRLELFGWGGKDNIDFDIEGGFR